MTPTTHPCRLCGAAADFVVRQTVLHRYAVAYFRCPECDLLQTEKPYWLAEAYDDRVAILDTGAVDRNLLCADLVQVIAWLAGVGPGDRCLDVGGGSGLLVRMMRDRGFDFRWADKFAANLYARGFEGAPAERQDLVTAFEVFEHFDDVNGEVEGLFGPGHRFVLASTFLHRGHRENWWYYVPEVGQHVAFYSRETMAYLGRRFGYDAVCGPAFTLFAKMGELTSRRRKTIGRILAEHRYREAQSPWVGRLLRRCPKYPSRTGPDQDLLRGRGGPGNVG
jgi:hypothetical protein